MLMILYRPVLFSAHRSEGVWARWRCLDDRIAVHSTDGWPIPSMVWWQLEQSINLSQRSSSVLAWNRPCARTLTHTYVHIPDDMGSRDPKRANWTGGQHDCRVKLVLVVLIETSLLSTIKHFGPWCCSHGIAVPSILGGLMSRGTYS